MPNDFKIRTPEKNSDRTTNHFLEKNTSPENFLGDEEVSTAFKDLHISAFSKAVSISPVVTSVTLGISNAENGNESNLNDTNKSDSGEESLPSAALHSSTPEKNKSSSSSNIKEFVKMKQKLENLSPINAENKISLENGISYQKLLNELDAQRRLTVEKVMRERIQNMYDTGKLIRESLEHLKRTKQEEAIARRLLLERKILDDIHEQEILNKPKREAEWAKDNLKEAQRIQERNQRVKEAEEEARKKSECILLKKKQIDQILFLLQEEYNQEFKSILETIRLCKDKTTLAEICSAQSKLLKECSGNFEKLSKKCKQGNVIEEDFESAKKLVETIKSIHEEFSKEIKRIHQEIDAKKEEKEKKTVVEQSEIQDNKSNAPPPSAPSSDLSDCFDSKSLETYLNLKSMLENWEKSIEPLLKEDSMKKFRFNCQKAVNIPVNAISPVSGPHLSDKYLKLHNLLSGRTVEVGDVKVAATQHDLGVLYCKYLLAKKFVRQGDLTVSSKPDAAFSIAAVLASLWVDFPDFGQLVLANFQLACPYLAPVFLPQVEGQSDEEYHRWVLYNCKTGIICSSFSGLYIAEIINHTINGKIQKSLGYHYSQNGEVEKQDSFLKRMSGIMRLYAALLISNVRQASQMNPLGLSEGWRWISALLNLEPRPDICATLLYDFLEVAGNSMFKVYGEQFKKMLAYICQEYFPKLEKVTPSTAGGPMVRLEDFLQKILKEESIPSPNGVLLPNFW